MSLLKSFLSGTKIAKIMVPYLSLNDGHRMPSLGLGTSQFENHEGTARPNTKGTQEAVEYAIDIGIRHFDTAYNYENEGEIGQAIKRKIQDGTVAREDLFITTKMFNNLHRADNNNVDFRTPDLVLSSVKKSLASLELDYVDLYLIHTPMSLQYVVSDAKIGFVRDSAGNRIYDSVDHAETWKAMETLVDLGLAKSIGVSNFNVKQLQHLLDNCRIKPAVNQVECHAYLMQPKLFEFCRANSIAITGYAPLGSPGRWDKREEELVLAQDSVVVQIAQRLEKTPHQILIRYLIERGRAVIPRSTNPAHIKQNFDLFDFQFNSADLDALDGLDRGLRFFSFAPFKDAPQYPFE